MAKKHQNKTPRHQRHQYSLNFPMWLSTETRVFHVLHVLKDFRPDFSFFGDLNFSFNFPNKKVPQEMEVPKND